uniref:Rho guanine nucleotide exchange factor 15b n=1 Tax=Amphilophus citrinellus TaxID=61819 RepID=A0A3Q0SDF0_AMPCI
MKWTANSHSHPLIQWFFYSKIGKKLKILEKFIVILLSSPFLNISTTNSSCVFLFFFFYPEPDGKEVEVELTGGGEVEVEHSQDSPASPCCAPSCSCICHLQQPGMKLIWVAVNMEDVGQEDGGGEHDDSDGVEQRAEDEVEWEVGEAECGDEVDSDLLGTCLPCFSVSEPLYQTYRASVITKEIPGTGNGTGSGGPRGSPVPSPSQNTLWQELPNVRESGVLEKLSPEECKYQESMFEVLTSEASYLRSLRVLTEHFMESRELEETMIIRDRKTLFSNILRIREVSERFLKDLEDRIFKDLVFADICDIIHYHAQHNFPAYIDYVRNQIYQEKIFSELMKNNTQFNAVITRLQESHHCQRLPFVSFLLLPFQRITRIKMLIENILKRTKEGTKEEQTASKALTSVSKIIDECNTEVGKMKQMEELIHISKTLEFDKLKAIPIISQTRFLEKKGELQEMSRGGTLFNMRAKFNPVYFFLFNDLLVITAKKGAERFVVLDHAHRSLVQVQPAEESGSSGGPYEHCFSLTLLENHQGRMLERLIKQFICFDFFCMNEAKPPISLFFCLPLLGWYEGTRLSDGQKGWFPVMNVIEITNEHVRRRNLRERYRVMQAAAFVANSKTRTLQ